MIIKTPILVDFPMPIETERLVLRPLQAGDGKALFQATEESRDGLNQWLLWPKYVKTWEDSEKYARESFSNYILRKSLNLGIFKEGEFIGTCGFNYFLWHIPSGEIGYWCKTSSQGHGYMREAVKALTQYGFKLGLKRIVITCLDENKRSAHLAESLGFSLEVRALGLMQGMSEGELAMARRYVRFDASNL